MKTNLTILFSALMASAIAWAAPTKYVGNFEIAGNAIHKQGVAGTMTLNIDGDTITQVVLKTTAPVFGQSEFASTEQAVFSNSTSNPPQMAVAFKLKGPPHKWYYLFVSTTTDGGKSYTGSFLKATGTLDDIKKALDAGTVTTYKQVGTSTVTLTP